MNVAPEYHQSVRVAYGDQSEEYLQFLRLMNGLKNRRTNIMLIQLRIRDIFEEHPELVAGFNTFLPVGYEIFVKDQNEYLNVKEDDFEDAVTFKVKVHR
ncbi:paired amphipathic helix protein Sin3-like 1 [Rhododendron vialii]|uniref:paired amphipathic helix protein Sin3-like 1 n=1 Tax=Rhododendron vialii TaxID=182163 RepID=UPI00265DC48D|nr:paired amphipathic helix protein Sin3-like 1 [Rhododendron vialii]